VGSLYQYFRSKTALLAAVAEMVMAEADATTASELAHCLEVPWDAAVDRVLHVTFAFYRNSPHYRQLLRTIRFTGEFAKITAASNERVADWMSLHPGFARAGISRDHARVMCRAIVTAANALQDRILVDDELDFDVWLEETRRMIKGYLGTYLS